MQKHLHGSINSLRGINTAIGKPACLLKPSQLAPHLVALLHVQIVQVAVPAGRQLKLIRYIFLRAGAPAAKIRLCCRVRPQRAQVKRHNTLLPEMCNKGCKKLITPVRRNNEIKIIAHVRAADKACLSIMHQQRRKAQKLPAFCDFIYMGLPAAAKVFKPRLYPRREHEDAAPLHARSFA